MTRDRVSSNTESWYKLEASNGQLADWIRDNGETETHPETGCSWSTVQVAGETAIKLGVRHKNCNKSLVNVLVEPGIDPAGGNCKPLPPPVPYGEKWCRHYHPDKVVNDMATFFAIGLARCYAVNLRNLDNEDFRKQMRSLTMDRNKYFHENGIEMEDAEYANSVRECWRCKVFQLKCRR